MYRRKTEEKGLILYQKGIPIFGSKKKNQTPMDELTMEYVIMKKENYVLVI